MESIASKVEAEEQDDHEDLVKTISCMEEIRREEIADKMIINEKRNEYLILSHRLASIIKELADQTVVEKKKDIADALN